MTTPLSWLFFLGALVASYFTEKIRERMSVTVASDESPERRQRATDEELAKFADWAAEFMDFLHSIPTADEEQ